MKKIDSLSMRNSRLAPVVCVILVFFLLSTLSFAMGFLHLMQWFLLL
ncbi:Putative exported protein [Corynebacterium diphtheriae]|uniref:Exported protein n=1 Tax=Corynebacterium diphtheriae (strain ATCC 700971 / NCTC 13129 / Biotype gravis) TaxID=257309 RepID=Q6NJQ2_CORDI|nr:Putative exported protein [Corynebacterium diphtheriae]